MTIDDLVTIFETTKGTGPEWVSGDDAVAAVRNLRRDKIAAVVRALRDEMTKLGALEFQDSWAVLRKFGEILNDAGDEKVGTHGSPELDDDARKLEAMGQDTGATLAAEPAPAVCEWTDSGGMLWATECGQSYGAFVSRFGKDAYCPRCNKTIKFSWRPRNEPVAAY